MLAYLKVACGQAKFQLGAVQANASAIQGQAEEASAKGVQVLLTPELALCGQMGDVFGQGVLREQVHRAVKQLVEASLAWPKLLLVLGAPYWWKQGVYSAAYLIQAGELKAVQLRAQAGAEALALPSRFLRYTNEAFEQEIIDDLGCYTLLSSLPIAVLVQEGEDSRIFLIGIEFGAEMDSYHSTGECMASQGALVLLNLASEYRMLGSVTARRQSLLERSKRLGVAYLFCAASAGESGAEAVYSQQSVVAEEGVLLAEASDIWASEQLITAVVDLAQLEARRQRRVDAGHEALGLALPILLELDSERSLGDRIENPLPFFSRDLERRQTEAEEAIRLQGRALIRRLQQIGTTKTVLGVSGGLDSTLALLAIVRAYRQMGYSLQDIHAITMPGLGTSARTKKNALALMKALGVQHREISIAEAVRQHFRDIQQDEHKHDIAYENSQARERTQILMDVANQIGALVVGTGDLSELALGWCTYNGDHMSMYALNASIPKSLVRVLVEAEAKRYEKESPSLAVCLRDIVETPISPELLPSNEKGEIQQKTEDSVGPYPLHDFFLYHSLRYGTAPRELFLKAVQSFGEKGLAQLSESDRQQQGLERPLSKEEVLHWQKRFYQRFVTQQFKRACSPDGVGVTGFSFSPRGDWQMPSDLAVAMWKEEMERLSQQVSET